MDVGICSMARMRKAAAVLLLSVFIIGIAGVVRPFLHRICPNPSPHLSGKFYKNLNFKDLPKPIDRFF